VVSIPEAKEGHIPFARTIHSKYLVVDGTQLALGTSNWEESYFMESRNVELIFRDSPWPTRPRESSTVSGPVITHSPWTR